jgi:hypothetical protein
MKNLKGFVGVWLIVALFASVPITVPARAQTSANVCPSLTRLISLGSRGNDVLSLQQFLGAQGLLSSASFTGYFGVFTQAAVKQWQTSKSIVSSGTAATTGFGVVGPRTKIAIVNSCGRTVQITCPIVDPPACTNGTLMALGTDQNGCNKGYQCKANTTTCPVVMPPQCVNGTLVSNGTDSNGCSLGYQCRTTQVSCPAVLPPQCTNGTLVSNGADAHGCSLGYQCQPNQVTCPIVVDPPACTNGTLMSLGTDSNGCNKGYQCVAPTGSPSIAVSLAQVSSGNQLSLSWQATNAPAGATVGLSLVPVAGGGQWMTIAANKSTTGSMSWQIPDTFCSADVCGISLTSGQYLVRASIISRGQSVATSDSPQFAITVVNTSSSVTINGGSAIHVAESNPFIYGMSSSAASIRVVVTDQSGSTAYDSGVFAVDAGQWNTRVNPPIPFGIYTVTAYSASGQVLATMPLYILGI